VQVVAHAVRSGIAALNVVAQLRRYSPEAADQVERAASSIVLNLAEGGRRHGRDPRSARPKGSRWPEYSLIRPASQSRQSGDAEWQFTVPRFAELILLDGLSVAVAHVVENGGLIIPPAPLGCAATAESWMGRISPISTVDRRATRKPRRPELVC
jgi:hypothetical protein